MKARLPKGMGGGPQNMQAMLKQAQKMQEDIEAKKNELEAKEYVVTSGGGMVEAVEPAVRLQKRISHGEGVRIPGFQLGDECAVQQRLHGKLRLAGIRAVASHASCKE